MLEKSFACKKLKSTKHLDLYHLQDDTARLVRRRIMTGEYQVNDEIWRLDIKFFSLLVAPVR